MLKKLITFATLGISLLSAAPAKAQSYVNYQTSIYLFKHEKLIYRGTEQCEELPGLLVNCSKQAMEYFDSFGKYVTIFTFLDSDTKKFTHVLFSGDKPLFAEVNSLPTAHNNIQTVKVYVNNKLETEISVKGFCLRLRTGTVACRVGSQVFTTLNARIELLGKP